MYKIKGELVRKVEDAGPYDSTDGITEKDSE